MRRTLHVSLGLAIGMSLLAAPWPAVGEAPMVNESARQIPVAYEVDVVVVGGSTGAVSAAVAAAEAGARVFLAAPALPGRRHDRHAAALARRGRSARRRRWPRRYSTIRWPRSTGPIGTASRSPTRPIGPRPHCTPTPRQPSRLADRIWGDPVRQSVQYDERREHHARPGRTARRGRSPRRGRTSGPGRADSRCAT